MGSKRRMHDRKTQGRSVRRRVSQSYQLCSHTRLWTSMWKKGCSLLPITIQWRIGVNNRECRTLVDGIKIVKCYRYKYWYKYGLSASIGNCLSPTLNSELSVSEPRQGTQSSCALFSAIAYHEVYKKIKNKCKMLTFACPSSAATADIAPGFQENTTNSTSESATRPPT